MVFFSPLAVEVMPGSRYFRLTKNFYVRHKGSLYIIPKGFLTDFASVPRALWPIFPPHGKYTRAAVFHDWLYQFGPLSRLEADRAFLEAMQSLDVPLLQRRLMYRGVRLGGGRAWSAYSKAREMEK